MLRELTEYDRSIREEMEATLSEIKKNLQGTNRGVDEAGNQMDDLEYKKEKHNQSEQ